MKNIILLNFTTFFLLLASLCSAENSPKNIILKDGSIIKGTVTKMENGIYTVVSDRLGEIEINDLDIANIQANDNQVSTTPESSFSIKNAQPSNLNSQVQAMQGTILNDPEMMKDIMSLMDDPEIQALLSDQAFINDVTSMNQDKILKNDKMYELMNNPKMQKILEKAQSRFTESQATQP